MLYQSPMRCMLFSYSFLFSTCSLITFKDSAGSHITSLQSFHNTPIRSTLVCWLAGLSDTMIPGTRSSLLNNTRSPIFISCLPQCVGTCAESRNQDRSRTTDRRERARCRCCPWILLLATIHYCRPAGLLGASSSQTGQGSRGLCPGAQESTVSLQPHSVDRSGL